MIAFCCAATTNAAIGEGAVTGASIRAGGGTAGRAANEAFAAVNRSTSARSRSICSLRRDLLRLGRSLRRRQRRLAGRVIDSQVGSEGEENDRTERGGGEDFGAHDGGEGGDPAGATAP